MAGQTAAFYDLDGTILDGSVVDHYIYYARTDPHLGSRAKRMVEVGVKAPYYIYLDKLDRKMFNHVFYASYKGLSEDRLAIMGETLFEKVLSKKFYDGVLELIQQDRAVGHRQVLLTGALDFVAKPVARFLGIEDVQASQLEYDRNGLATGILRPPVMAGPEKAAWMRQFAIDNAIDLQNSLAYADDAADLPMLSMVGKPIAVNPDKRLMATARSHGWPVLYIDTEKALATEVAHRAFDLAGRAARKLRDQAKRRAPAAKGAFASLRDRLREVAQEARGTVGDDTDTSEDSQ